MLFGDGSEDCDVRAGEAAEIIHVAGVVDSIFEDEKVSFFEKESSRDSAEDGSGNL